MTLSTSDQYCLDEVRRLDHDRYLTALLLPAAARSDVLALYAFSLEVARTREIVSEPILGQIRLQWWRETLEGIYAETPREHPVVEALATACQRNQLDGRDSGWTWRGSARPRHLADEQEPVRRQG